MKMSWPALLVRRRARGVIAPPGQERQLLSYLQPSLHRQRNEHQELPPVRHQIELPPVLGLHEALDRQRNGVSAGRRLLAISDIHWELEQLAVAVEVEV